MSKMSGYLDLTWPQMASGHVAYKTVSDVNRGQDQKFLFLFFCVAVTVFIGVFTIPTARAAEPYPGGADVRHVRSVPHGEWLGKWRSQDGKNSLAISSSTMASTFLVQDEDGKFGKVTVKASWSNLTDSSEEETFGLSKKHIKPAEIAKRYEMALQRYKKNSTDFGVSDPNLSRQAISAMSPRSYLVMWSYFGGESGSEYIVDKDHMLEIKDDPYGFYVTLYDRAK